MRLATVRLPASAGKLRARPETQRATPRQRTLRRNASEQRARRGARARVAATNLRPSAMSRTT
eukprot:7253794-Alexandrium_andersonii.AAC.1